MNIDRLSEIAVWLESDVKTTKGVSEFDMRGFIENPLNHQCGTCCCIAGAAIQFSRVAPFANHFEATTCQDMHESFSETAANLLGLDEVKADDLFFGRGYGVDLTQITPAWAARCIRKLIATGEVDWVGTRYV